MSDMTNFLSTDAATNIDQASADLSGASLKRTQSNSALNTNASVSSMQDLQKKAPQVYQAILQAIAQSILSNMQDNATQMHQTLTDAQG